VDSFRASPIQARFWLEWECSAVPFRGTLYKRGPTIFLMGYRF